MAANGLRGDKISIILLDTSGIIHAISRKIDLKAWFDTLIDSPYKLCLTKPVLEEIERLSKTSKGKMKSLAKLSLKMLEGFEVLETQTKNPDDSLLEAAITHACFVFTCDAELKNRLREHGIKTFIITNDNRVTLT